MTTGLAGSLFSGWLGWVAWPLSALSTRAVGAGADALLPADAHALLDAGQHIGHEGALSALTAGRADLLVVEHHPDVAAALFLAPALQKAPQGGVSALEVIDAAGHEILAVQAHADGFFTGGEDEVGVEDVLGLHAGFLRQNVLQAAALAAEDGLQIHLRVVLHAVVEVAAEVDAEVGDAGQRTVGADADGSRCRSRCAPAGGPPPSGDGQTRKA